MVRLSVLLGQGTHVPAEQVAEDVEIAQFTDPEGHLVGLVKPVS
ncbi:MAG TPA: hypothetical protein VMN35_08180 [Gaiellaceae bacterium]|nr:hypothetical protein [Gaiellaceae bacterium]